MTAQKLSAFFLEVSYRFEALVAQQPDTLPIPPSHTHVFSFMMPILPKCRQPAVVLEVVLDAEQRGSCAFVRAQRS